MTKNRTLIAAKIARQDEFYTQLEDIEKELRHYEVQFHGKSILCNCDDPFQSNFFRFFVMNFERIGLKKLLATNHIPSSSPEDGKKAYKAVVTSTNSALEDLDSYKNGSCLKSEACLKSGSDVPIDMDALFSLSGNSLSELEGDGDFRSPECLEVLEEADIVVTNPPFSRFRELVRLLMVQGKNFLIMGGQLNIASADIFPLLQGHRIWLGYTHGTMEFRIPDYYGPRANRYWMDESGRKYRSFGNLCWFTNLMVEKQHAYLPLTARYDPDVYPKYDNFDAIDVPSVAKIPRDYAGNMGVPVTFMYSYNPEQFDLIGCSDNPDRLTGIRRLGKRWVTAYRRQGGTGHFSANMRSLGLSTPIHRVVFSRIIIRNRHPDLSDSKEVVFSYTDNQEMITELDRAEKELQACVQRDKRSWIDIYRLMHRVEVEKLYEGKYRSYTQWVNSAASRFGCNVSLLWARLKAGRTYTEYQERQALQGNHVPALADVKNVSPDSIKLCQQVAGKNAVMMDDLIGKVVDGTLSREDLRMAARVRKDAGYVTSHSRHSRIDPEQRTENDPEQVTAESILLVLKHDPSWIPTTESDTDSSGSYGSYIPRLYKVFPEQRTDTGSTHHVRRINAMIAETRSVTDADHICLRGIEIKVSRSDLAHNEKMAEYCDYCDYFYLAVPDGDDKMIDTARDVSLPEWGILVVRPGGPDKDSRISVIREAEKLSPRHRERSLSSVCIRLMQA